MKKPSIHALKRAKSTLLGRALCRLAGEERGMVMMEYVVIGVLVVAAAVAAISLFGKNIRNQFGVMNKAVVGNATGASEMAQQNYDANDGAVDAAMQTGDTTANYGNSGAGE
ncbi:MAG: hypothetical protein IJ678_00315 [Kiritimatiellae bacterium]|nr:hypothetical protein [Kiritimatiellia bacterium]